MGSTMAGLKESLLRLSGLTAYKWSRLPDGLYCFNYHRIGDRKKTQFDPNVFSCTPENFQQHLKYFKQHFQVLNLTQLQSLIGTTHPIKGKYALITFDDGYMDNFDLALPLLLREKLPAVFFVSSDFVGSGTIPWWDQVAWWVRHSMVDQISFGHQVVLIRTGNTSGTEQTIRSVLRLLKADPRELELKLSELKILLKPVAELPETSSLFMGWSELNALLRNGMAVGSHTCGHKILSHLSKTSQLQELQGSKQQLENELNIQITALAYPIGDELSFNQDTFDCAAEVGYKVAFNFTNRINLWPIENALNISRIGISNDMTLDALQHKLAWHHRHLEC